MTAEIKMGARPSGPEQRMALAISASRMIGFLRVTAIAAILGTTELSTAFSQSNAMSNVLFELLAAGALSAAIVPALVRADDREGDQGVAELARGILGMFLTILLAAVVLAIVLRTEIARMLTSTTDSNARASATELVEYWLLWFIPQVLLYAAGSVAIAVLTARRRLVAIGIAPIGNTIVLVAGLIAARLAHGEAFGEGTAGLQIGNMERIWLGIAGTGGVLAFVAIPIVVCAREGIGIFPTWGWKHAPIRNLARSISWAVLQSATLGVILLAGNIATAERAGGAQIFAFAMACFLAPYAVLAQPIQTAVLPPLTRASETSEEYTEILRTAVRKTLGATFTMLIATIGIALPAMRSVLFGASGSDDAPAYAAAFIGLIFGLPAYSLFLLATRARYASGDMKTPAIVGFFSACVGGVLMITAGRLFSGNTMLLGVGIATAVAWTLAMVILATRCPSLRRSCSEMPWNDFLRMSVLPGSIIAVGSWVLAHHVEFLGGRIGSIAIAAVFGGCAVLISYRWLRTETH